MGTLQTVRAVRSASLLEQREFELPVLFGLFPLGKGTNRRPFSARIAARSLGELFSDQL
jgi:hypothetical protein